MAPCVTTLPPLSGYNHNDESSGGLSRGGVPLRQSERQSIRRDPHTGCEFERILAPGRKSQLDKIRRETFRGRSNPNAISPFFFRRQRCALVSSADHIEPEVSSLRIGRLPD